MAVITQEIIEVVDNLKKIETKDFKGLSPEESASRTAELLTLLKKAAVSLGDKQAEFSTQAEKMLSDLNKLDDIYVKKSVIPEDFASQFKAISESIVKLNRQGNTNDINLKHDAETTGRILSKVIKFKMAQQAGIDVEPGVLKLNDMETSYYKKFFPIAQIDSKKLLELSFGSGDVMTFKKAYDVLHAGTMGALVTPDEYSNNVLDKNLQEFSLPRKLATVSNISGDKMNYPTKSSSPIAMRKAKLEQMQKTNGLAVGEESIESHSAYVLFSVTRDMIKDARIQLESFLMQQYLQGFSLLESYEFIHGTGTGEMEGLYNNTEIETYDLGETTSLTNWNSTKQMQFSVKSFYANNARYLLNRMTLGVFATMQDDNKVPLNLVRKDGSEFYLFDLPVAICPEMDNIGSGKTPIICGDVRTGYTIQDSSNGNSMLYNPYSGQLMDLVTWTIQRKSGGKVMVPEAFLKGTMRA